MCITRVYERRYQGIFAMNIHSVYNLFIKWFSRVDTGYKKHDVFDVVFFINSYTFVNVLW